MLTAQQLAEIEARDRARTPGKWTWRPCGVNHQPVGIMPYTGNQRLGADNVRVTAIDTASIADAAFIAGCSTDISALLATVRELLLLANRAYPGLEPYTICSRLHHGPDYTCQVCFPNWPELQENWYRKNNELQAENDALRARNALLTDRLWEWSHAE